MTDSAGSSPSVYEREVPGLGTLSVTPVDPARDIELIAGWVAEERAQFWGMRDAGIEGVREIYAYIDSLTTHHAYLLRRDGVPVGLFQTYDPAHDPFGEYYDLQPGDGGMHLMMGPATVPVPGLTAAVTATFISFMFSDPTLKRIVVEPDVRNRKAVDRLLGMGFTPAEQIELPEKTAQLVLLTRDEFEDHLTRSHWLPSVARTR